MKPSHHFKATVVVDPAGRVLVPAVPFQPGERVEVHVTREMSHRDQVSLRGTVIRYDAPFEPAVPPEDWDADRT
jgi:hypothetical protein